MTKSGESLGSTCLGQPAAGGKGCDPERKHAKHYRCWMIRLWFVVWPMGDSYPCAFAKFCPSYQTVSSWDDASIGLPTEFEHGVPQFQSIFSPFFNGNQVGATLVGPRVNNGMDHGHGKSAVPKKKEFQIVHMSGRSCRISRFGIATSGAKFRTSLAPICPGVVTRLSGGPRFPRCGSGCQNAALEIFL